MALVVKNLSANAGDIRDTGSNPESGRCPGGGHGNTLQYSWLENAMDRGAWRATVHRVSKSQTQLKRLRTHSTIDPWENTHTHTHTHTHNPYMWSASECFMKHFGSFNAYCILMRSVVLSCSFIDEEFRLQESTDLQEYSPPPDREASERSGRRWDASGCSPWAKSGRGNCWGLFPGFVSHSQVPMSAASWGARWNMNRDRFTVCLVS